MIVYMKVDLREFNSLTLTFDSRKYAELFFIEIFVS